MKIIKIFDLSIKKNQSSDHQSSVCLAFVTCTWHGDGEHRAVIHVHAEGDGTPHPDPEEAVKAHVPHGVIRALHTQQLNPGLYLTIQTYIYCIFGIIKVQFN